MNDSKVNVEMVQWYDEHYYKIEYIDKKGRIITIYVPSVTTILNIINKPFLARWRGDISNREADLRVWESQEKGSRVHNAWYTFNTGGIVIYNPWEHPIHDETEIHKLKEKYKGNYAILRYQDEMHSVYKLQKWVDVVKPQFIYSEHILYSLKHKTAGTGDNIVFIEEGNYLINGSKPVYLPEGLYILDLKTGNAVYDESFMQIGAYAEFAEEMGLGEIVGGLIIHTNAKTRNGIPGLATYFKSREELHEEFKTFKHAQYLWDKKHQHDAPKLFTFPSLIATDILANPDIINAVPEPIKKSSKKPSTKGQLKTIGASKTVKKSSKKKVLKKSKTVKKKINKRSKK